jgi:hypothetical protein
MRQPDFRALFYKYLSGKPRKVAYAVRPDSNCYHDLVFLASLIHDARFKRAGMHLAGKRLTIPINRDCWELGIVDRDGGCDLYVADARLTISPVLAMAWRFGNGVDRSAKVERWINDFWLEHKALGDEASETRTVVIDGFGWQCRLKMPDDDLKIVLQDIEVPCLYSRRHPEPKTKRRKR